MKRPQPQRFRSTREREQHEEMQRQKKFFAALAVFPQDRLCSGCQDRHPFDPICPGCRAKIEEYAGG